MKQTKHLTFLFAIVTIGLLYLSQGCSAASLSGVATPENPAWFKITIPPQSMLNLQVNAANVTANNTLVIALSLGIVSDFGQTPILTGTAINSTHNATLLYQHVHQTPLYLVILYFAEENSTASVAYTINCSHPIVTYSYAQYYNDVVYPDIVSKTTVVGILVGGIALIVTVFLLRRRQKEKATVL